jgi:hypothetical protein
MQEFDSFSKRNGATKLPAQPSRGLIDSDLSQLTRLLEAPLADMSTDSAYESSDAEGPADSGQKPRERTTPVTPTSQPRERTTPVTPLQKLRERTTPVTPTSQPRNVVDPTKTLGSGKLASRLRKNADSARLATAPPSTKGVARTTPPARERTTPSDPTPKPRNINSVDSTKATPQPPDIIDQVVPAHDLPKDAEPDETAATPKTKLEEAKPQVAIQRRRSLIRAKLKGTVAPPIQPPAPASIPPQPETTEALESSPEPAPRVNPLAALTADLTWLWLPGLSLVVAIGLLLIAYGYSIAPGGTAQVSSFFWSGLRLMFAAVAIRLIAPNVPRQERISLVMALGLGLYFVKALHSPTMFTFSDELQHWRTADDILQYGELFRQNPLLPVSPLYPGLEIVTSALASSSGLSIFAAGMFVLGVARLVGTLALFLFYEQIGGSARVAGVAALLYMVNPSYLFFDAQFAYESLAIPLTALILFAAAHRSQRADDKRLGLTLIVVLGVAAVIITHHVTTYALIMFLVAWSFVAFVWRRFASDHLPPYSLLLLTVLMSLSWIAYVASITITYLERPIDSAGQDLIRLLLGESVSRELFRTAAGELAPAWERLNGFASVGLILIGLPFGLLQIWRSQRTQVLALTLALGALAYPASLAARLTNNGAEVANRASAFLFVAIAFVLAAGVISLLEKRWSDRWAAVFGVWATVVFSGGVIVGWPLWARIPGPYMAIADTRSIEGQGLAAADWVRAYFETDSRIIADRINRLLMGSYGEQRPVTHFSDRLQTAQVVLSPTFGPEERQIVRWGKVRYIVVDQRLSRALPSVGSGNYFERGEPGAGQHTTPIDPAALAKFDNLPLVSRVFDSGDIIIYDGGALQR